MDTPIIEDDNILKDPDWVKTPIGRRVMEEKKNLMKHSVKSKLFEGMLLVLS